MKNVFIKYNKANIHALGSKDGQTIKWLKPGWNEFPKSMWDEYANHQDIHQMINEKVIEVMDEKIVTKGDSGKKVTKDLSKGFAEFHIRDLDEKKAIEIVNGTNDMALLDRWLDEETRHKVKRAVETKRKPLLPENQAAT